MVPFGPAETTGSYHVLSCSFTGEEAAPPPHVHPNTDEAFYVAEGHATFLLGDEEIKVRAGGFVFVPRGTVHTVVNAGDGPARGLLIISPGDAEHAFVPVEAAG